MTSVNINSVGMAIASINSELNKDEKAQLFGSIAFNEISTLEKRKDTVKGMILANPCPYLETNKDEYNKDKSLDDWRETSGYDATQIFIEGLNSIENDDDINRKAMLTFLENKKEEVDKSMKWKEERSVIARNYCSVQVIDGSLTLID